MTHLEKAIASAYGTDPYLGTPDPRTIAAIASLVEFMCEVSKRRPVAYANESWLTQSAHDQFEHMVKHADTAWYSVDTGECSGIDDDGLPHAAHAALRIAFGLVRLQQEDGK